MITAQIRRDAALRTLSLWALTSALTASFLMGIFIHWISRIPGAAVPVTVLVVWASLAVYLTFGPGRRRSSLLELTLPLPAHRLWLAHVLAVVLGGSVVLALSLAVVILTGWLPGGLLAGFVPTLAGVRLILLLAAGLVLAVVALESDRPHLHEVPAGRVRAWRKAAVLTGVLLVLLGLAAQSVWWILALLAGAGALGWRTWRNLPPALALLPREPGAAPAPWTGTWTRSDRGPAGTTRQVLRVLLRHPPAGSAWFSLGLIGLMGAVIGGGLAAVLGEASMRQMLIPFGLLALVLFTDAWLSSLPLFDSLPLGRRRLFGLMAAVQLGALVAGYGLGHLALRTMGTADEGIALYPQARHSQVWVPPGLWEIAWDGRPPEASSPWGESHAAWRMPLYRGSRAVLYSPWSAPPESSPAFVAHQLAGAAEAVYGRPVDGDEIRERYLEMGADGRLALKNGARFLELEGSTPIVRPAGPALPVFLVLVTVPWLFFLAFYFKLHRASAGLRMAVLWGFLGLLFVSMPLGLLAAITDVLEPRAMQALFEILVRELGSSPWTSWAAAWAVLALVAVPAYRLAARGFERLEAPARPVDPPTLWK